MLDAVAEALRVQPPVVLLAQEGDAARGQPIAAGAPCLLHPRLDGARQPCMHHEPHIRLVHSHTEGDRRDDDLQRAAHERTLHLLALERGAACVVPVALPAARAQVAGRLVHLPARVAVDDRRAAGRQLIAQQRAHAPEPLVRVDDLGSEVQVGTEHSSGAAHRVRGKAQCGADRSGGALGGSGGQPEQCAHAKRVQRRPHRHVARPEIVRPLRQAMCLIDACEPEWRERRSAASAANARAGAAVLNTRWGVEGGASVATAGPGGQSVPAAIRPLGGGRGGARRGCARLATPAARHPWQRAQCLLEVVIGESLGSNEEEARGRGAGGVASAEGLEGGPSLVCPHVRREGDAMQAAGQLGYLVGDQRKQRRDHDRDLGAQERRQLVHERFAAPRRQHEQRRLTTQQTAHRLELALLELLKPESPSQRLVEQRIDRRAVVVRPADARS